MASWLNRKKPIVFYLDSVMPSVWVKYIREGVEEWNKAFQEIGFKDVVLSYTFPERRYAF